MNLISSSILLLIISSVNYANCHAINLYTKYCVDSSQNCYNQDLCGTGLATDYLGSKETAVNGDVCLPWDDDLEFHFVRDIKRNLCRSNSKDRPWCYVRHNETHSEAQDCFKSCNEEETDKSHDSNILGGHVANFIVKVSGNLRAVVYGSKPKPVRPSSVPVVEESEEGSGSSIEEGSGMNSSGEDPISSGTNIDEGPGDDASESVSSEQTSSGLTDASGASSGESKDSGSGVDSSELNVSESISSGSDSSGIEISTSEEPESEGSGSNASGANILELEGSGSPGSGVETVEESSGLESEELVTAVVEEATVTPKQGATVTPKFEGSGSSSVSSEPSGEVLASGNGSGQDSSEEGSGQQIITEVTNEISSGEGSGEVVTTIIPQATTSTELIFDATTTSVTDRLIDGLTQNGMTTVPSPKTTNRPSPKRCVDTANDCVNPRICLATHWTYSRKGGKRHTQSGVRCYRGLPCKIPYGKIDGIPWCRTSKSKGENCYSICGTKSPDSQEAKTFNNPELSKRRQYIQRYDPNRRFANSLMNRGRGARIQNFLIKNSDVSIHNS